MPLVSLCKTVRAAKTVVRGPKGAMAPSAKASAARRRRALSKWRTCSHLGARRLATFDCVPQLLSMSTSGLRLLISSTQLRMACNVMSPLLKLLIWSLTPQITASVTSRRACRPPWTDGRLPAPNQSVKVARRPPSFAMLNHIFHTLKAPAPGPLKINFMKSSATSNRFTFVTGKSVQKILCCI